MAIAYNSNYIETLPFSDTCKQFTLVSGSEQTWTIPGNATQQYQAYFGYNDTANVFVSNNVTPTIPTSNTNDSQQYTEFRPKKRYVKGGDVIHFLTPDDTVYMGVSLRQLQG